MLFSRIDNSALFEEIIRKRIGLFQRIAVRILRNQSDADDAVQNALLKAWRKRFFIRKPERMAGWIVRIVINECYNVFRDREKMEVVDIDMMEEEVATPNGNSAANYMRVENAIASLPPKYRETIHVAVLSDLNTEAAAEMLGCSPNTLYTRIGRARMMLREALKDE